MNSEQTERKICAAICQSNGIKAKEIAKLLHIERNRITVYDKRAGDDYAQKGNFSIINCYGNLYVFDDTVYRQCEKYRNHKNRSDKRNYWRLYMVTGWDGADYLW